MWYVSFILKGEQGSKSYLTCQFIGEIQVTFRKCVLYLDNVIFQISPLKVELEALAGTIAAVPRTSGPNIYINHAVKRTGEICGRHDKRSKNICGAVPNRLCSSLHYSTQRSCWQTVLIAPVQNFALIAGFFGIFATIRIG